MTTSPESKVVATVLVVDDEPANRSLLQEVLETDGHAFREAADGAEALRAVAQARPDAILLDVEMPELDGIEVCRRLKADPETAPIPIILVTAHSTRDERLSAMAAGAIDFLAKPVDLAELRARLRNALETKRLYDQAESRFRRIEDLERRRDLLVSMIAHDMRSPLATILASLELGATGEDGMPLPSVPSWIEDARCTAQDLTRLLTAMVDVSRLEAGKMPLRPRPAELEQLARSAAAKLGRRGRNVTVVVESPENSTVCDPSIILRVLINLLSNALDFTPPDQVVGVRITRRRGAIEVTVSDRGPGIPPEAQARIFEKFEQVHANEFGWRTSSGLGLAFCKLAVEAHDGEIGVTSTVGEGSDFWFRLPVPADAPSPTRVGPTRGMWQLPSSGEPVATGSARQGSEES
jgi:signal transduction histidine kinase